MVKLFDGPVPDDMIEAANRAYRQSHYRPGNMTKGEYVLRAALGSAKLTETKQRLRITSLNEKGKIVVEEVQTEQSTLLGLCLENERLKRELASVSK